MAAAASSSSASIFSLKTQTHRQGLRRLSPSTPFPSPSAPFLFSLVASYVSISRSHCSNLVLSAIYKRAPFSRVFAVVDEQPVDTPTAVPEEQPSVGDGAGLQQVAGQLRARPCRLYVCNLPRSCDIEELHELFKPYGTVQAVEVSRDSGTGISKGCGFVTLSSIPEGKAAIEALDGSDLGGREVRVRYAFDVFSRKKNLATLNRSSINIVFETPHKAYVGNLAWSVRPKDLREHFSQFGTVVSTRILFDRKTRRNRVFGFVSFSSAEELEAAIASSGTEFLGRTLLVRQVIKE